jgi:hypothetical protein
VSVYQFVQESTWILPLLGGTRFLKSKLYMFPPEVEKLFEQQENLCKGWIITMPEKNPNDAHHSSRRLRTLLDRPKGSTKTI